MAFGAKVAAIEFAGDAIRVVVARTGGGRPKLLEAHEATAVYEAPEQRRESLVHTLDAVLEKLRHRPASYVLCVNTGMATLRTLTVPFKGAARVAKAVPLELEPYLPFPMEELMVDFSVIKETNGETEVFAMGMRRKHMEELLSVLEEIGIDPEAVVLDTAGLTALWMSGRRAGKGLEAVLHLRAQGCELAVTYQHRLAFIRHITLPGGLVVENPQRLAREVQNTLRAFMAQWKSEGEIDRLSMTGVYLTEEELAPFSQSLNLPVESVQLLTQVRGGAAILRRDGEVALYNHWEGALGAAQSASGGGCSCDLLQAERTWEGAAGGLIPHLIFSACLGLIFVLGWGFYYHQLKVQNDKASEAYKAQISELETAIEGMASEGLGSDLDVTVFSDPPLLDVLMDIGKRMPEKEVNVLEIKVAPPGARGPWISITGETANAAQFNTVFEGLKKASLYKVADDTNIRMQGEKTTFRVRAFRPQQEIEENEAQS